MSLKRWGFPKKVTTIFVILTIFLSKNRETTSENANEKTPNMIPFAKFMEPKTIMKAK